MHQNAGAIAIGSEKGAGSILGLGLLLALLSAVGIISALGEFGYQQVRLQALADTTAIVVSDALQGLITGYPCENAEDLLQSTGVQVKRCSIVGESANISLASKTLGIVLNAEAIAEPMQ